MLDRQQRIAVETIHGPVLVCAGPGSGKTRTLVERVLHLLRKGVKPSNILILAFTNKAAKEIKDRLEQKVQSELSLTIQVTPYTIHSLCLKILKKEVDKPFLILDEHDQLNVIQFLKKKLKAKGFKQKILSLISNYKNQSFTQLPQESKTLYKEYQKYLNKNNLYDYDDILIKTLELLENKELIRKKYQEMYKYILVDEYQDINEVQNKLIKLLALPQNNTFVIGDADQSIYSFRGANFKLFLEFNQEFKDAKTIKLRTNYRSTPSIANASLSLILHNKDRLSNNYRCFTEIDFPVFVCKCGNEKDEAKLVSDEIEKIIGGTTLLHMDSDVAEQNENNEYQFNDFAVLYRKNSFAKYLEQEFLHKGIPYQIIGINSFWNLPEIRDVISVIKYLVHKNNFVSKFLNPPNIDLDQIKNITDGGQIDVEEFVEASGLKTHYRDDKEALENLSTLIDLLEEYKCKNLEELSSRIALQSRETYIDERANCVKLLTFHQAKGLEFANVFIAGCEEGNTPLLKHDANIEEERRLFYVGMTRAKSRLYLSYTQNRLIWGKRQKQKPSRFLKEINQEYVHKKEFIKRRKKKEQTTLF
ncbi:ATP-dependent helicase [Candidatus Dojkabacteria bacterium]|nr:ATP-dependent helicase [Candidatus Dojkabacteria bacterium]